MKNSEKYEKNYFVPPVMEYSWHKKNSIESPPLWCSVDLRDGNQALITPMSLSDKIEFFKLLVSIGFKDIEIGFPAAFETEYVFCRKLIEENLIPSDVRIQVLTQAREHIIDKTFAALEGAKNAVVHVYNSTSKVQRDMVFRKSQKEILEIASLGAKMLAEKAAKTKGNFTFEYSPESFSNTEPEYALEVINEVLSVWKPTKKNPSIINLPDTVQLSMPHVYANQVEYISRNINNRESVILSLHPHNDRGCSVAAAELGVLAGGDRVEGTLFGNGERTGNVDLMILALNLYMHGVDPKLDFSSVPKLVEAYEKVTDLPVHPRHPYAGQLVFTAFSGSHQDAIAKGFSWRKEKKSKTWAVPYLPIDPVDIGKNYDKDVIRINAQSGKGGIGYLLENNYGYNLPKEMREEFSYFVKSVSDKEHRELDGIRILALFKDEYVNIKDPIQFVEYTSSKKGEVVSANIVLKKNGKLLEASGESNGVLDAVAIALDKALGLKYNDMAYFKHALESGSKARAAAYVGIEYKKGSKKVWGCGVDSDIVTASIQALVGAVNRTK